MPTWIWTWIWILRQQPHTRRVRIHRLDRTHIRQGKVLGLGLGLGRDTTQPTHKDTEDKGPRRRSQQRSAAPRHEARPSPPPPPHLLLPPPCPLRGQRAA